MSPAMTNAAITLTSEVESVLGTLSNLLDRESDAVQASNFDAFKDLQNDKFAMMSRYRALMETLKYQAPTLKGAGEAITGRLAKASAQLHDSVQRNSLALERGSKSMQRIVDRIVRVARDTVYADRQSYKKDGSAAGMAGNPLSIRIDEVL